MQKHEFFTARDELSIIAFLGTLEDLDQWVVRENYSSGQGSRYCASRCFLARGFFRRLRGYEFEAWEVVTADAAWSNTECTCNGRLHKVHEAYPEDTPWT